MTDIEFLGKEFFDEAFKFWFKDNKQIRTPFPEKIQAGLKEKYNQDFYGVGN